MSRELDLIKRQAALKAPFPRDSTTRRGGVDVRVERNEEVVAREAVETLPSVPGHVLNGHQGAVGIEEAVEVT